MEMDILLVVASWVELETVIEDGHPAQVVGSLSPHNWRLPK